MKRSSHGKSLKNNLSGLKRAIIDAMFPKDGSCPSCGRVLLYERYLCGKCDSKRRSPDHFCIKCNRATDKDGVCSGCGTFTVKWDMSVCAYTYEYPTDEIIWHMKYRNKPHLAQYLAKELAEEILKRASSECFDIITFIPSSEERLLERGYNQSRLLAMEVGNLMDIPVVDCLSAKDSEHQVGLGAKERYENALDRFSITSDADISGKRIILIDDVLTTGSTMAAACVQLKSAGAEYILAATVAQTVSFVE